MTGGQLFDAFMAQARENGDLAGSMPSEITNSLTMQKEAN
jgi:hypothetical protein